MVNRTTGKSPFFNNAYKFPNHSFDLLQLPQPLNKQATSWANDYAKFHEEITKMMLNISAELIWKGRNKAFKKGELVIVHLNKHRLPTRTTPNLQKHRKYCPFSVLKKINDNSYIISLPSERHISSAFNVSDISTFHPPEEFWKNSCEDTGCDVGA